MAEPDEVEDAGRTRFLSLVLTLCKYYHWPPDFWRRMGRRYFYAIVDDTYRAMQSQGKMSPGSWDGYEHDSFWRRARRESGRKQVGERA